MLLSSKIYIAWHNWLVWSAIKRNLEQKWYTNLILKNKSELNLLDSESVRNFFEKENPEYVFICAAKVWWIMANNKYPADFIYENLQIQNNLIHQSYLYNVKKLLFLWSSCIYPKFCPQPMKEEYLLTWELEQTNEPYAIAKISWIKMCQSYNRQYGTNFIACMPTNLYWPWDNFDLENSHVLPAMIAKFYNAKIKSDPSVVLRGDGSPMREFLYVDDMADACVFMMQNVDCEIENDKNNLVCNHKKIQNMNFLNIGTGKDISIKELAITVQKVIWYEWNIIWDTAKPNGTMRKLLDNSQINSLWWKYKIDLEEGIRKSYKWFLNKKI